MQFNIYNRMRTVSKTVFLFFLLIGLNNSINAQDASNKIYNNDASIQDQFKQVVEKSSKWQNYIMVLDNWAVNLQKNTLDTLSRVKNEVAEQKTLITQKENAIKSLETTLEETKAGLSEAIKERNSFSIVGMKISKGLFLTTTWLIIIALAVFSFIAMGLYKKSFSVVNKTNEELAKTNEEFETYRKDSRKKYEQLVVQHHKEMQKLKEGY